MRSFAKKRIFRVAERMRGEEKRRMQKKKLYG
jgi:hypothetical protein